MSVAWKILTFILALSLLQNIHATGNIIILLVCVHISILDIFLFSFHTISIIPVLEITLKVYI